MAAVLQMLISYRLELEHHRLKEEMRFAFRGILSSEDKEEGTRKLQFLLSRTPLVCFFLQRNLKKLVWSEIKENKAGLNHFKQGCSDTCVTYENGLLLIYFSSVFVMSQNGLF